MKKVKKILCALLVVVMCLSSAPLIGFDFKAEAADYQVGDIIQFGSYPQSEVKDEALIEKLNELAPEWDEWTSYEYYSGNVNFGSMKPGVTIPGNWMRYTDITYNNARYRGIKFTQYRPMLTFYSSSAVSSNQYENGYSIGTVYWFKFEAINWRVLDPAIGLVMCETIIDSQPHSNIVYRKTIEEGLYEYFNDSLYTTFANDYETSTIRKWLNHDFYNIAFTSSEKAEISSISGSQALDINGTSDKIFLLSYNEVINRAYGFSSDENDEDIARRAQGSDYAKSQGLYVSNGKISYLGNSGWRLCSPTSSSNENYGIDTDGQVSYGFTYSTSTGIRPALKFIDITDIDTPTDNPTPDDPTPNDPKPDKPENTAGIIIDSDIYAVKVNGVETSKIFTILDSNLDFDKVTAWDIVLTVDGVETQPEGKVTVRIPVPVGYNAEKCKVYHIDPETGKLTDMNARVENGYFVFVTDHFSIYSVVELHEHSFGDKDAECSCGFDRTEGCSCNCHKGGIMGFFFKIILFFQKLFKSNQVCKCGIAHY